MVKNGEFGHLPEEHPQPRVSGEVMPLPPEFPEHGPKQKTKSKKKSALLASSALLLLTGSFLFAPAAGLTATVITQTADIGLQDIAEPVASATPEPAAVPAATPAPVIQPECHAIFVAFSDKLEAKLLFTTPEAFTSVRAELWFPNSETADLSWDIPLESIQTGEYNLPDMPWMYDLYMASHPDFDYTASPIPTPELRVYYAYAADGTEVTDLLIDTPSHELGYSVTARDGELVFRSYETENPGQLLLDDGAGSVNPDVLHPGDFLIHVAINGETVPATLCTVETEQEESIYSLLGMEDTTESSYSHLVLRVPQQGDSGTAVFTVTQKLEGSGAYWTDTRTVAY